MTFHELETTPRSVELSEDDAEMLRASKLVNVSRSWCGGWDISPTGMVGAVQVGELLIEVRPKDKVGLSRLMFMLGYAADPGFSEADTDAVEEPDFFAAIAHSFARQCERALQRGPLSSYVTVEESLRVLRGKIRVGDQISRHLGLPIPLEVTFDDFTKDIAENRILRTAIRIVLDLTAVPPAVRERLSRLDRNLDGVKLLPRVAPWPQWQESRANAHYIPALRMAALIRDGLSVESGKGRSRMSSFAVDMAKVFEDFVTTAIKESMRFFPGTVHAQFEAHLDEPRQGERPRTTMYVDAVYCEAGIPRVVFDAKYKASQFGSYSNADEYQMLAYCTALDVPRAWLLYAGAGSPRIVKVRNTNKEIVHFPLDLSLSPERLLERVQNVANLAHARKNSV
ncbi:McrC family protein [Glutamicibacter sp. ZJUTW]|nr:restriction endonuclease [Glutamicibacter sp. ZJUTW]QEP08480.1 restriction endonuclease [Glutamicibacter sp. ZJUTW]